MSLTDNQIITVSVVNFHTAHLLTHCVASIEKYIPNLQEIIIINHSGELIDLDTTASLTILDQSNCGFGAGHNYAIANITHMGRNHFHLFLNPDAILTEDITPLLEHFNDNNVAVVGPQLIDSVQKNDPYAAGASPTFVRTIIGKIRKPSLPCHSTSIDWVSGAAMMVRLHDFLAVAGFDENYFLYFEDADLCHRLRNDCGKEVIFDPQTHVLHSGGQSFTDKHIQKKYYDSSQDRYFRIHRSRLHATVQRFFRKIWRTFF